MISTKTGHTSRLTNLERRDELRKGDNQEVKVEKELELLVKGEWKECRYRVLLIADYVWRVRGFTTWVIQCTLRIQLDRH